tara:strand:- start:1784 stop:2359 length:576 start_codon:yes stop_codon:yes gene_type:complete
MKTVEKPIVNPEFKFSTNWLRPKNLATLKDFLSKKNAPINILELGTFEGRSAFYMLDEFCSHKDSTITTIDFTVRKNLEYNLSICNNPKFTFIHDDFFNILPKLLTNNKKYDLIYLDGGKNSKITLFSIVNCWELLGKNGILYLDDYEWGLDKKERPKEAIDFFLSLYHDEYTLILKNFQVAVKKIHTDYE